MGLLKILGESENDLRRRKMELRVRRMRSIHLLVKKKKRRAIVVRRELMMERKTKLWRD